MGNICNLQRSVILFQCFLFIYLFIYLLISNAGVPTDQVNPKPNSPDFEYGLT